MADFVRVASLGALPEGGLLGVELDDQKIVLANVAGTVYALEGICTHQDAMLADALQAGTSPSGTRKTGSSSRRR